MTNNHVSLYCSIVYILQTLCCIYRARPAGEVRVRVVAQKLRKSMTTHWLVSTDGVTGSDSCSLWNAVGAPVLVRSRGPGPGPRQLLISLLSDWYHLYGSVWFYLGF